MRSLVFSVLGVVVLVATACSGATTPSGSTTQPTAVQQDELRIAVASLGNEVFDPIKSTSNNMYLKLIYDSLVGTDSKAQQPSKDTGIAKDWSASADFKTYTFFLRQGVKFENGDEITADDVKFSLDRWNNPKAVQNPISKDITRMTIKGPYEIEVVFSIPRPLLPVMLTDIFGVFGMVLSKKYAERVGDDELNLHPMGTGPYKLAERQTGAFLALERSSAEHFATGKPRYKTVRFNLVSEESTRLAMLRSKQADFIDVGLDKLDGLKKDGYRPFQHGLRDALWIYFQLQRSGEVTRDINLRRALDLAIDRNEINATLLGGIGQLTANVFPGQAGVPDAPPHTFDLAKAKEALAQTKFGPGGDKLSLNLWVPQRPGWPQILTIATALKSYWSKIGVDTVITYRDYGSYRSEWAAGRIPAPAVLLLNYPGTTDWARIARLNLTCKGQVKSACDPEFDKLVDKWDAAGDPKEYESSAQATWKYIDDHLFVVGIANLGQVFVGDDQIPSDYQPGYTYGGFNERKLIAGK